MPVDGNSFKTTISIPLDIYELIKEAKTPNFPLATFIHQLINAVLQDEEFVKDLHKTMINLDKKELFPVIEILLREGVSNLNKEK